MATTPAASPSLIRATINIDFSSPANVVDMNTLWLRAASGPVAILAAAIADATSTTFTFASPLSASLVGKSLLIDQEPVSVTAQSADNLSVTVQRFLTAFPFMAQLPTQPASAHAAGGGVFELQTETPWVYIAQRYFLPAFQQEVLALGKAAASFGTLSSGSLSTVILPTS